MSQGVREDTVNIADSMPEDIEVLLKDSIYNSKKNVEYTRFVKSQLKCKN